MAFAGLPGGMHHCRQCLPSAFSVNRPLLAADLGELQPVTRIAAAGAVEPEAFAFRPGLPVRETEIDADLKLLLAQNGPPAKTDAEFGDDTILVAFALSVPKASTRTLPSGTASSLSTGRNCPRSACVSFATALRPTRRSRR